MSICKRKWGWHPHHSLNTCIYYVFIHVDSLTHISLSFCSFFFSLPLCININIYIYIYREILIYSLHIYISTYVKVEMAAPPRVRRWRWYPHHT